MSWIPPFKNPNDSRKKAQARQDSEDEFNRFFPTTPPRRFNNQADADKANAEDRKRMIRPANMDEEAKPKKFKSKWWKPTNSGNALKAKAVNLKTQAAKYHKWQDDKRLFGKEYADKHLEEKHWIKGAIKHPGALTAAAKREGVSNSTYEHEHEHDSGKAGDRARLALRLKAMHENEQEVSYTENPENRAAFLGMMDAIATHDAVAARQAFDKIMTDKVNDVVDAEKIALAQEFGNDAEPEAPAPDEEIPNLDFSDEELEALSNLSDEELEAILNDIEEKGDELAEGEKPDFMKKSDDDDEDEKDEDDDDKDDDDKKKKKKEKCDESTMILFKSLLKKAR